MSRLVRRLRHRILDLVSREHRIKTGMLTGRYTINEGRALLGLPLFTGRNARFADQRHWVSPHGVTFRETRQW